MTPRLLRTFLAVARCGTATRAAGALNLAQSSVSDQIQLLEDELGLSLFLRSRQGFRLTAAGEALLPYAQDILATTDDALAAMKRVSLSGSRSLVIGTLETIAREVVPTLLADLRQHAPELTLRVDVAGSGHLIQRVLDGNNDIAFCFRKHALDERLVRREFTREQMVMIGPPTAGNDISPSPALAVLASRPFIATEPGCVYRHLFDQAWCGAGLTPPRPIAEVSSIDAIVRLVAAGSGYALVPKIAAQKALERGTVAAVPSSDFDLVATLDMIWRRRRVQPPGLALLLTQFGGANHPLKRDGDHLRHEAPCPL